MRRAHSGDACQRGEVAGARVGAEHASDGLYRRMHVNALDDVVAVDEGPPSEPEEVGEPRVEQGVVDLVGCAQFSEELFEASRTLRVEATRELAGRVLLLQHSHLRRCRGPDDEAGAEDRPPELVVAGLVDQHVILTREEPGERARRELVATFVEQVRGGATHDEVDLELEVPMRARLVVARGVSDHPSIDFMSQPEVFAHRKKR